MKKIAFFSILFIYSISFSQVAIGNLNPNPHAQLDVSGEKKGVLIPKITLSDVTQADPFDDTVDLIPESLLIYNDGDDLNVTAGYYYWNGIKWNKVIIEDDLEALPKSPWNKEGTTDTAEQNDDNIYQEGRVGIGENGMTPGALLDVRGDALINGLTVGRGNSNNQTNIAVGISALGSRGLWNTAIGYQTLQNNNGDFNTAIGYQALNKNNDGLSNTANGYKALSNNTSGKRNIATGTEALSNNTTGSMNIAIGNSAGPVSNNLSNTIAIGYEARVDTDNTIQLGNGAITDVYTSGKLHANTFVTTSDRRYKENIKTIPLGLDFINKIRPVEYSRKNNEKKTKEWGVIAQELQQTLDQMGYLNYGVVEQDKTPDKYLSVAYTELIAPLIKAVQELSLQNEELKKKNDQMENEINEMKKTIKQVKIK